MDELFHLNSFYIKPFKQIFFHFLAYTNYLIFTTNLQSLKNKNISVFQSMDELTDLLKSKETSTTSSLLNKKIITFQPMDELFALYSLYIKPLNIPFSL
jgi:hypothetical protein